MTSSTVIGKNIIICSDGTGNKGIKGRGTNVFKIFEAVDNSGHFKDKSLARQVAYYDDGVGTSKFAPVRIASGAFGLGVARNVRQLYRQICRAYKPGDRIYMFGFSRGAYTVRTLASIITACGLVDLDSGKKIPYLPFLNPGSNGWLKWISWRAWRAHRRRFRSILGYFFELILRGSAEDATEKLRNRYALDRDKENRMRIHFIGVWDTVSSVGLPFDLITWIINHVFYRFSFPNFELNTRVEKACQALAIDEERASFKPVLWRESNKTDLSALPEFRRRIVQIWNKVVGGEQKIEPVKDYNVAKSCLCEFSNSDVPLPENTPTGPDGKPQARIEQVWFPGVHSDIGGGYPKQGLSYVTLDWMMDKAEGSGLRFSAAARDMVREQRNVFDKMHDSRAGAGTVYRYKPRDIARICKENQAEERVHAATFERILDENKYRPALVSSSAQIVKTSHEALRDVSKNQEAVTKALQIPSLDYWIQTRIAMHWILIAIIAWVLVIAKNYAGGWGELGSGLLSMWSSPIDAAKKFFLAPLTDNSWYWFKRVGVALAVLATLSYSVQNRIATAKAKFWNDLFYSESNT